MRLPIHLLSLTTLALCAAPAALACENPDDVVYVLRNAPPKVVQRGDVVLELDVGSRKGFSTPGPVGEGVGIDKYYITFDVKRVVAGKFNGDKATISYIITSCSDLGASVSPTAYLLAGPEETAPDGTRYLQPRTQTAAEFWAELPRNPKAAH